MEKKKKIKIKDLPKNAKVTEAELKQITGGLLSTSLYRSIVKRPGDVYADGPCYNKTFCY